ncbi:MAG: glycosyltransferase [Alsobacter sp.]
MSTAPDLDLLRQQFERELDVATTSLERGRGEEAAVLVQMAAARAWYRHPGCFYSARAEALLAEIARGLSPPPRRADGAGSRDAVLHVLTQAYPVGGHTRVVTRWIQADPGRRHIVALTQQAAEPVPEAVRNSSAELHVLDRKDAGLFKIVARLQSLIEQADAVILHQHPFDVVPILALAAIAERPAVGLFNHADHVFWLGSSVTDLLIGFRDSGSRLAVARRGFTPDRVARLPLPLPEAKPLPDGQRAEARARLGLSDRDEALLSVASGYKFSPLPGSDFCALHWPLLEQRQGLRLLVVGPSPEAPYWAEWNRRSGGRIRALGIHPDLAPFFAASDVYVDSAPFGSLTSLLEAAVMGLPVLSWRSREMADAAEVLVSDDPALDPDLVCLTDPDAYRAVLAALLDAPEDRRRQGQEMAAAVRRVHTGAAWVAALGQLHSRLEQAAATRPASIRPPEAPSSLDTMLVQFQSQLATFKGEHLSHFHRYRRVSTLLAYIGLATPPATVPHRPMSRRLLLSNAVREVVDAMTPP